MIEEIDWSGKENQEVGQTSGLLDPEAVKDSVFTSLIFCELG